MTVFSFGTSATRFICSWDRARCYSTWGRKLTNQSVVRLEAGAFVTGVITTRGGSFAFPMARFI
jgi:hypothetical protein